MTSISSKTRKRFPLTSKAVEEGSISTFGDENLLRKYRAERVEMWLRGAITTELMEDFLKNVS